MSQIWLFFSIEKIDEIRFKARIDCFSHKGEWILSTIPEELQMNEELWSQIAIYKTNRNSNTGNPYETNLRLEKELGALIYKTFLPEESNCTYLLEDFLNQIHQEPTHSLSLVITSLDIRVLDIPFSMMRQPKASDPLTIKHENLLITKTIKRKNVFLKPIEPIPLPLKILFVNSLPYNLPENQQMLDIEKEQEKIIEALGDTSSEDKILIEFLNIGSLKEIERALTEGSHQIIHISGHGFLLETNQGFIIMEGEDGLQERVRGDKLAEVISRFSCVQMVILSACETGQLSRLGVSGALHRTNIPIVIGMHYPISDNASILFSHSLYKSLCTGRTLIEIIYLARKAILDAEKVILDAEKKGSPLYRGKYSEWFSPSVYVNRQIGKIFDPNKNFLSESDSKYFFGRTIKVSPYVKTVGKGFIGRRKQISILTKIFNEGNKRSICIHGLGGLGKSSLAFRFIDNYHNKKFNIIYLGENILTVEEIINESIDRLKEIASDLDLKELDKLSAYKTSSELIKLLLNLLSKYDFVLFFDNFEVCQNYQNGRIKNDDLRSFLTHVCKEIKSLKSSLFLIITTRYKIDDPELDFYLNLSQCSFPDAYKLMSRLPNLRRLNLEQKKEIYTILGGHPKAIELFNSRIKDSEDFLVSILQDVKSDREEHDLSIKKLWDTCSKEEKELLACTTIFRSLVEIDVVSDVFYQKPGATINIREILISLNKKSLIYLEYDSKMQFLVYPLIKDWIISDFKKECSPYFYKIFEKKFKNKLRFWHQRAGQHNERFVGTNPSPKIIDENIKIIDETIWHYSNAKHYSKMVKFTIMRSQNFRYNGSLSEASHILLDLLREKKELARLDDTTKAFLFNQIGINYRLLGSYLKALEYQKKSANLSELSGNLCNAANSYLELFNLCHKFGKLQEGAYYMDKYQKLSRHC